MMDDEQQAAQVAIQFMARVQLQGQEVPAFNAVMTWLATKAESTGVGGDDALGVNETGGGDRT